MTETVKRYMTTGIDLKSAWYKFVEKAPPNDFKAGFDDPNGNWKTGDEIRIGLRLANGRPNFYAQNLCAVGCQDIPMESIENTPIDLGFTKSYFPHRALRPQPPTRRQPGIQARPNPSFEACGYKCQEPAHNWSLLHTTPFVTTVLPSGRHWACFANFAPFELEGHFLWLPIRPYANTFTLPHFPQKMIFDFLTDVIYLWQQSSGQFMFFNSLHAGASQDHFHLQTVCHASSYAIYENQVAFPTNSLLRNPYHLIKGYYFSQDIIIEKLFKMIDYFDREEIPYNLLMIEEKGFLVPSRPEFEVVEEFPYGAFGASEVAGRLILTDRDLFDKTDIDRVKAAFSKKSFSEADINSFQTVALAP